MSVKNRTNHKTLADALAQVREDLKLGTVYESAVDQEEPPALVAVAPALADLYQADERAELDALRDEARTSAELLEDRTRVPVHLNGIASRIDVLCTALADDSHVQLAWAIRGLLDGYQGRDRGDLSRAYRKAYDVGSCL